MDSRSSEVAAVGPAREDALPASAATGAAADWVDREYR